MSEWSYRLGSAGNLLRSGGESREESHLSGGNTGKLSAVYDALEWISHKWLASHPRPAPDTTFFL